MRVLWLTEGLDPLPIRRDTTPVSRCSRFHGKGLRPWWEGGWGPRQEVLEGTLPSLQRVSKCCPKGVRLPLKGEDRLWQGWIKAAAQISLVPSRLRWKLLHWTCQLPTEPVMLSGWERKSRGQLLCSESQPPRPCDSPLRPCLVHVDLAAILHTYPH